MKKFYRNVIIVIAVGYFLVTLASQQKKLNQYQAESTTYTSALQEAEKRNEDLQETKANANSTEYIEEVAREKLDMYLPNERVYIDSSK